MLACQLYPLLCILYLYLDLAECIYLDPLPENDPKTEFLVKNW